MFWSLATLLIGRTIFGYSLGLLSVIVLRYIEETIPLKEYPVMAAFFYMTQGLGYMIALLWGEYLDDKKQDLEVTERWRAIWFYFPLSLLILYVLLLIMFLKNDSIKHLILSEKKEEA